MTSRERWRSFAKSSAIEALHAHLFERPAGALACALGFFAVSAALAMKLRFHHDEGLLTFDFARGLLREPLALVFFVKAKPVLLALALLPSAIGLRAYLLAHAAMAAGAVYLASAAARHLRVTSPNVAGWVLATSFSFTVAASNGYPNAGGCFALSLFLYLYLSGRRLPAALVLGALPFARNELAPVTLIFLALDVIEHRSLRFVLATLSFGAIYGAASGVYHGDPLWLYSGYPDPQGLPPKLRLYQTPTVIEAAQNLRQALLDNSPLLVAFGLFGVSLRDRRIAAVFASMIAIYFAMTAFQIIGVLGFDTSPRYYVAPLPLLALTAAWALSPAERPSVGWWAAPAIAATSALTGAIGAVFTAIAGLASALFLGAHLRKLAECLLLAGAIGIVAAELASERSHERRPHLRTHELVDAMRREGIYRGQPLYTDDYAARYDLDAGLGETHVLVNQTIDWELRYDTNPRNGQYEKMVRALEAQRLIFDPARHAVRRDAVYVLEDQERTKAWRARIEAEAPSVARIGDHFVYSWPE